MIDWNIVRKWCSRIRDVDYCVDCDRFVPAKADVHYNHFVVNIKEVNYPRLKGVGFLEAQR